LSARGASSVPVQHPARGSRSPTPHHTTTPHHSQTTIQELTVLLRDAEANIRTERSERAASVRLSQTLRGDLMRLQADMEVRGLSSFPLLPLLSPFTGSLTLHTRAQPPPPLPPPLRLRSRRASSRAVTRWRSDTVCRTPVSPAHARETAQAHLRQAPACYVAAGSQEVGTLQWPSVRVLTPPVPRSSCRAGVAGAKRPAPSRHDCRPRLRP
jgi:hypothetical protein